MGCSPHTPRLSSSNPQKDAQRVPKLKPFINKYYWEGINFPSEKDVWKNNEKNNVTIALNVFYAKKNVSYFCFKI